MQEKETVFVRLSCFSYSGVDFVTSHFISQQIGFIQNSFRCETGFPEISQKVPLKRFTFPLLRSLTVHSPCNCLHRSLTVRSSFKVM